MSRKRYKRKSAGHRDNPVLVVLGALFTVFWSAVKTLIVLAMLTVIAAGIFAWKKVYPIYQRYEKEVAGVVENSTLETFRLEEASFIYDSNGDAIAKLTGDEDSSYLNYRDIPREAVNAFVAVEDRTFWENPGIDPRGIARVIVGALRSTGDELHGASTITQQLARNRFLTREVSIERKVKEMLIAIDLNKKYTKEQIMEFYINDINYANTYYGLAAAARGYFGKEADQLSLSQITYLCAIPNSPTYYNPYNHPERALERRNKILDDMLSMGYISERACKEAKAEKIEVARQRVPLHNFEATYAIDCAVRYLMRLDGFEFKYGFRDEAAYKAYTEHYNEVYQQERNALYTGGYSLYTSLDPVRQAQLQSAVDEVLSFDEETAENGIYAFQGAATAVDNATGKVVAIVGGRSQETSTYTLNRGYQGFRQPGSTIKPLLVYTPALENGYRSDSEVVDIDVDAAKEKGVVVRDLDGDYMPLRRAVERSRNGVAWSVYDDLTPALGMAYLTQMRFDKVEPSDYYNAQALGGFTNGVTTEEMAGAYSALVNHGLYREPTCITKLVNNRGKNVFQEYEQKQVYQETSADMMVDILRGVITRGTASSMGWSSEIAAAGKTGTTNRSKDGWFCGITPYYTISVWVGYDMPRQLSDLYGATYPASIWKKGMMAFIEGKAPASFREPLHDLGMGNGEYLGARAETDQIDSNYTVRDFRTDHQTADHALNLIYEVREGNGGSAERAQAKELIAAIISPNLKQRMEDILKRGRPGKAHYVWTPDPVAPQPVPEVVEDPNLAYPVSSPAGPASDVQPADGVVHPVAEPAGPGME